MKKPFFLAVIQARSTSSRLPGKVLQDIAGETMLERVVKRVRRAQRVDQVLVATTVDPTDDTIFKLCEQRGFACYRGSLHDVLDRFYQASQAYQVDGVIRITADCPLIDPALIDLAMGVFLGQEESARGRANRAASSQAMDVRFPYDFVATRLPPPWSRTYPIGLDIEICSFMALERAWREAVQGYQREHVMPYLYDDIGIDFDQPCRFRVFQMDYERDYGAMRWTVDTPPDLALIRSIYLHFAGRDDFSWLDVLALIESHPELAAVNAGVQHKTTFDVDQRRS